MGWLASFLGGMQGGGGLSGGFSSLGGNLLNSSGSSGGYSGMAVPPQTPSANPVTRTGSTPFDLIGTAPRQALTSYFGGTPGELPIDQNQLVQMLLRRFMG